MSEIFSCRQFVDPRIATMTNGDLDEAGVRSTLEHRFSMCLTDISRAMGNKLPLSGEYMIEVRYVNSDDLRY